MIRVAIPVRPLPHPGMNDTTTTQDIAVLVTRVLHAAASMQASSLHADPQPGGALTLRVKVDGEYHTLETLPHPLAAAAVARLKLAAGMKPDLRNMPQEGGFAMAVEGRNLELRLHTYPYAAGEKLVVHLTHPAATVPAVHALGLVPAVLPRVQQLLALQSGLVLLAGPTGSGRSTTAAALLGQLAGRKKTVATIERHLKYQIPGVLHSTIRPEVGLHWAEAVRAMMHQDADVLYVAEVPDAATAKLLAEAALGGKLVLAGMHAAGAAAAVERLQAWGLEPLLLATSLKYALGMRTARKICPHCREKLPLPEKYHLMFTEEILPRLRGKQLADLSVYRGTGCEQCRGLGHRGHVGVYELIDMTGEPEAVLLRGGTGKEAVAADVARGAYTLRHDALLKVVLGDTTIEEAVRAMS